MCKGFVLCHVTPGQPRYHIYIYGAREVNRDEIPLRHTLRDIPDHHTVAQWLCELPPLMAVSLQSNCLVPTLVASREISSAAPRDVTIHSPHRSTLRNGHPRLIIDRSKNKINSKRPASIPINTRMRARHSVYFYFRWTPVGDNRTSDRSN